jgi:hypothetical protein
MVDKKNTKNAKKETIQKGSTTKESVKSGSAKVGAEKNLKNALKATLKAGLAKNPLLKLKDFEAIKKDYELTDDSLTANAVMHKMSEILEFYLKLIQQVLQPEEFYAAYECNAFNDNDKSDLFELYKRLIISHRELLKAVIMNDEKNAISTVQFVHEEIKSVKPQMLEIVNKMQGSWKKGGNAEVSKGPKQYFG